MEKKKVKFAELPANEKKSIRTESRMRKRELEENKKKQLAAAKLEKEKLLEKRKVERAEIRKAKKEEERQIQAQFLATQEQRVAARRKRYLKWREEQIKQMVATYRKRAKIPDDVDIEFNWNTKEFILNSKKRELPITEAPVDIRPPENKEPTPPEVPLKLPAEVAEQTA